jgi:hypothetical protein
MNSILRLDNEEIVTWDESIDDGRRTATAEVMVRYRDNQGRYWSASRVVKFRLRLEKDGE